MQRNLIGKKFGKLLVIEQKGEKSKSNHYVSKVKCECGREYLVNDTQLINGRRKSCRKCQSKTHGLSHSRIYYIYNSMKDRCNNKNNQHYKEYGDRKIKVCDEWLNNFETFYNWAINNGYDDNLTLDRIDVNGNYDPTNCRWTTMQIQANNKRNNIIIEYKGVKDTLPNWARKTGINKSILQYRYYKNWDVEKMLTLKPKIGRNQYEN